MTGFGTACIREAWPDVRLYSIENNLVKGISQIWKLFNMEVLREGRGLLGALYPISGSFRYRQHGPGRFGFVYWPCGHSCHYVFYIHGYRHHHRRKRA